MRVLGEDDEHLELARGEPDQHAVGRGQAAPGKVERPAGEVEDAAGRAGAGRDLQEVDAAEERAHPRQQLARAERLGEVVVRPHFQADDAVGLLAHGGQHQDRDVRAFADLAAELEAVLAGEHDVEDDEVDVVPRERHVHLAPVADALDGIAVLLEEMRDEIADLAIVVDDQDPCRRHQRLLAAAFRQDRSRHARPPRS